jgi:hypothetical protein
MLRQKSGENRSLFSDEILTAPSSVTWSGGGDIREDSIKEWTMPNLKEVAMSFPDAVAACKENILFTTVPHLLTLSAQVHSV